MQRLSEYYKMKDMRPKLNTIFALTAAGDFNYRGSRQLAEEWAERQGVIGRFMRRRIVAFLQPKVIAFSSSFA